MNEKLTLVMEQTKEKCELLEGFMEKKNIDLEKWVLMAVYFAFNMALFTVLFIVLTVYFNADLAESAPGIALFSMLASCMVSISSVGEYILGLQLDIQPLESADQKWLRSIYERVYVRARQLDDTMEVPSPEMIDFFMIKSRNIDLFTIGKNKICVTCGFLERNMPEELLEARMAQELHNLTYKTYITTLLATVGNLVICGLNGVLRLFLWLVAVAGSIAGLFPGGGFFFTIIGWLLSLILRVFTGAFTLVWKIISLALFGQINKNIVFEADEFSYALGYGEGLEQYIQLYEMHLDPLKAFAQCIASTLALDKNAVKEETANMILNLHPSGKQRFNRLQECKEVRDPFF